MALTLCWQNCCFSIISIALVETLTRMPHIKCNVNWPRNCRGNSIWKLGWKKWRKEKFSQYIFHNFSRDPPRDASHEIWINWSTHFRGDSIRKMEWYFFNWQKWKNCWINIICITLVETLPSMARMKFEVNWNRNFSGDSIWKVGWKNDENIATNGQSA